MDASRHRSFLGVLVTSVTLAAGCGQERAETPPCCGAKLFKTISLDRTSALSATSVAKSYVSGARREAEEVLERGGHLRVAVFAGAGVAPAVLVDEDVPSADELRGNRRKRFVLAARANLTSLLEQALGQRPVEPGTALSDQLEALQPAGSDVAGAVYQEVELLRELGGAGELVMFSDALQRDADLDLAAVVDGLGAGEVGALLAPLMPDSARGIEIAMHGVGINGHGKVSTARSRTLDGGWTAACRAAGAAGCTVGTDL